jgi:hypothetical protein
MKKNMIAFGLSGLLVAGCASSLPPQFSAVQAGDAQASCATLESEIARSEAAIAQATSELRTTAGIARAAEAGADLASSVLIDEAGAMGALGTQVLFGAAGGLVKKGLELMMGGSYEHALQIKNNAEQRKQILVQLYYAKCS